MTTTDHRPASQSKPLGLIVIGDEILSGKRRDQHLPKVIELLAARGLQLAWADYVGDDPARITATLRRAFASGDIVFSCGGIGATPDDHTRQCAAQALGVPLVLHPEAEALIRTRMQQLAAEQGKPYEANHPDNVHRLNMGMFPQGARIIPNPYNQIPGFYVSSGGHDPSDAGPPQGASVPLGGSDPHRVGSVGANSFTAGPPQGASAPFGGSDPHGVGERGGLYFFPGFPVMAWPMMEWALDHLHPHLAQPGRYQEKSVIVQGAMEAALTPLMQTVERHHPHIKVFSLPSVDHPVYGGHIDLGVKGEPAHVAPAYAELLAGLRALGAVLGPELVRP